MGGVGAGPDGRLGDAGGVFEDGGIKIQGRPQIGRKTAGKAAPKAGRKAAGGAELTRARQLLRERDFTALVKDNLGGQLFALPPLWEGTVTLPTATTGGQSQRYRLAVAEYEEYLVDDATPYDRVPSKKDRRLVFIEYVELD